MISHAEHLLIILASGALVYGVMVAVMRLLDWLDERKDS